MVDRGANGGLAGSDMRVIHKPHRKINIQGIDNHEVTGLDVVTGATLLNTSQGKVIGIFNEYAYLGKGSSIHSSGQLEWFKTNVDEKSVKVGGTQLITTLDGYSVALLIKDGLAYATSLGRPQSRTWTHIHMSSSHLLMNGTPQSLTMILHTLMDWTPVKSLTNPLVTPWLMLMVISMSASLPTSTPSWMHLHESVGHTQKSLLFSQPISIRVHPKSLTGMPYAQFLHGHPHPASRTLSMSPPGMEQLHTHRITSKSTLSLAILFSTSPDAVKLLQQTPSSLTLLLLMMVPPWPNSSVAVILLSLMHMASYQPNNSSTPSLITSENEISKRVTDLLRSLFIQDYQSEPYRQHQNKAENRFGLAKRYTNTVMNTSGCPACCWLLCLQYICVVLNHLASPTLQGICPVQAFEGTTPDISFMLHFSFYEPVYYRIDSSEPDLNFPSSSNEKKVYWVGFADNQGDRLTWRILTEDTQKIIIRSGIRSALRTTTNQRLASPSGEGTTLPFPIPYPQQSTNSLPLDPLDESTPNFEQFVRHQSGEDEDNPIHMANIDIPNLLGRSFLLPPEDNGERHMAKIIDIDDHGQPLEDIKFKLKINTDQAEEIMSYNHLMDYIQKRTDA